MHKHLTKGVLALATAVVCGSVWASPATISVGFESPGIAGANFNGGDSFTDSGFKFNVVDPWGNGFAGFGVGTDPSTGCTIAICPSASSAYYATYNDGSVKMQHDGGNTFRLAGFDAGFVAALLDGSLVGSGIGQIVVTGTGAGGSMTETFGLDGIGNDGTTAFAHFDFSAAFSGMAFTEVSFGACLFDAGNCEVGNSFLLGNVALDAIQVIPEPSSYALVGLALVAAAGTRRRRAAATAV